MRVRLLALGGAAIVAVGLSVGPWHDGAGRVHTRGARVERIALDSRMLGRTVPVVLVEPPSWVAGGALVVLLHGRSADAAQWLSNELFASLAALGRNAPAVALAGGGDHSYYHDRRDGRWGSYVLREAIPLALRRAHADPRRIAIGGISMGGFGALDLARLAPRRFCAVGGHSPALWLHGGETPPGAFDDAEDFALHDVLAVALSGRRFGRGRVWLDAGDDDPFLPATRELARRLRAHGVAVELHVWPGGHDEPYWRRHTAAYLRFYARALARCPGRSP